MVWSSKSLDTFQANLAEGSYHDDRENQHSERFKSDGISEKYKPVQSSTHGNKLTVIVQQDSYADPVGLMISAGLWSRRWQCSANRELRQLEPRERTWMELR